MAVTLNRIFLLVILILTFILLPSTVNPVANNFQVTFLTQQHDFTLHNVTIEVKNLDVTAHNFNLQLLFSNLSFTPSQMRGVQIYEWKPLNTSFPAPVTQLVEVNSTYPKNMADFKYAKGCWNETKSLNETNSVFPCNVTKIIGTGLEWKMQADWKPSKMQLVNNEKNTSTTYGNVNIPKTNSKCDTDDFNTTLNCNGTKLFKITWETPITTTGDGFGSSGYYEISDTNTNISYDPPWGNVSFTKRLEVNFTNPDTKDHLNKRVMFHLANNTDILKFTQAGFQDIRVTNRTGSAIPFQKFYYNNDTRPDVIGWWINNTAGATVSYYIYFNSSTALDANSTIYIQYEFFENGSIYMNGGFTPFETDTGGLIRNVSITHNITNVTSLSSGQAIGPIPAAFRHNTNTASSKDVNGSFIISWWEQVNSTTSSFLNGLEQSTGPNIFGMVVDDSGAIFIMNGSNGLGNWVQTPHNVTVNTWNWFELEKNDTGEYYWFANATNKFFLGRDTALTENYSQISLGVLSGGRGGPLFEDFLIQQNVAGFGAQYNEYPIGSVMTVGQMENVTACQTISVTQNITATNDINNAAATQCIIIDAPNVVYDCANYLVDGTDAGSSIGFNVSSRADNTTIRNCRVTDWTEGIQTNAKNTDLDNITGFSNNEGIFFGNLPAASDGLVTSSNISRNTLGIHSRGNNVVFENTTTDANGLEGLLFDSTTSNTANRITVRYNGRDGISVSGGSGHTIINSIANSNSRSGILATGTTLSSFYNNTATDNILSGFVFQTGTTASNVENNTAFNNSAWDFNATGTAKFIDIKNLRITGNSNITLQSALGIAIKNLSVGSIPQDTLNYTNITRWLNVTNISSTAMFFINISYLDTDLPAGFAEGNLSWAKYNGTTWITNTSDFAESYGVDTVNNVVWANITNFTAPMGSLIFAPLAHNISGGGADTTLPIINYVAPTETNRTYLNRNFLMINGSATDNIAVQNITYTVYNSTGLYNETTVAENPLFRNYTNLADGNYTFNATATDTSNNKGYNETRLVVIDTALRNIDFVAPTETNQSRLNRNFIQINLTSTDINLDNLTITVHNSTGLFNETTVGGITFLFLNYTGLADGNYTFNGTARDKANNINYTSSRQVLIDTKVSSSTEFVAPTDINNSYVNRAFILANVSVTEPNLANITITLYNSLGLFNTSSNTTSPYFINFTNLADGNYTVNATATDLLNQMNYTSSRIVVVDTTRPSPVIFANPTTANLTVWSRSYIEANISANDINLDNLTINVYNLTGLYNQSNITGATSFFLNFTNLVSGNYTFNATARDKAGNENSTETRLVVIDLIAPAINFVAPTYTNNSNLTGNSIAVNVTATDDRLANITIRLLNTTNSIINTTSSTTSPLYLNFTNLADGNYTVNATATDTLNNQNTTTNIYQIDTIVPAIRFVSPTISNNTGTRVNSTIVNLTASDAHLANVTINIYNLTGLVNATLRTAPDFSVNFTNLTDGNYTINATAIDFFGWQNNTESRMFIVDSVLPTSVNFTSPSPANESTVSGTITFNATATDLNFQNITFYRNGTIINSCAAKPACTITFDTSTINNGNHTFAALAFDIAGNSNSTENRTFIVNNVGGGGGGGGGGLFAGENITNITLPVYNITELLKPKTYLIFPDTGITFGGISDWWKRQTIESILWILLLIVIITLITAYTIDRLTSHQ